MLIPNICTGIQFTPLIHQKVDRGKFIKLLRNLPKLQLMTHILVILANHRPVQTNFMPGVKVLIE